ncbi:YolD-like family protein [Halobacillus sp. MO56]
MDKHNKDRGTIKWTSLMLPEHVQLVKELWKEDERVEKGIIDEQKAVEIDFLLQRALNDNLTVELTYHNGFDHERRRGKINSICSVRKELHGTEEATKHTFTVDLNDIVDIAIR